jgi:hypothetical protein
MLKRIFGFTREDRVHFTINSYYQIKNTYNFSHFITKIQIKQYESNNNGKKYSELK